MNIYIQKYWKCSKKSSREMLSYGELTRLTIIWKEKHPTNSG